MMPVNEIVVVFDWMNTNRQYMAYRGYRTECVVVEAGAGPQTSQSNIKSSDWALLEALSVGYPCLPRVYGASSLPLVAEVLRFEKP